ncbi:hypothetical protein [Pleomorphovibrio marinus]|uniref:hypothetical protein n=1 Tax=Pleomorphovibrio marinus TaxID=2164132 RepID=UPI000E0BADF1|nr:hypothetical protein [Pleomorphovibrio marinus]
MFEKYYVNTKAQSNGDHEVHSESCEYLPEDDNRGFLGRFSRCQDALQKAKEAFKNADGCYYCCGPCHSS